jgi:hypothetical protein
MVGIKELKKPVQFKVAWPKISVSEMIKTKTPITAPKPIKKPLVLKRN